MSTREQAATLRRPSSARRWLVALLALAAVVEVAVAVPFVARSAERLTDVRTGWVVLALLAELGSMNAFARLQRRMLVAGGVRVGLFRMIGLTYAANAVSVTLPGGSVVATVYTVRRLRRWGASAAAAGFTVVSSGVLSAAAFAVLATVAAAAAGGFAWGSLTAVGLVAVVAVVVRRARDAEGRRLVDVASRVMRRANRVLRRPPDAGVAALAGFAQQLTALHPRTRDWATGGLLALGNWTADVVCLAASARAVGVDIPPSLLLLAWVAGVGSANLSLLPGGLGAVDAVLVLGLTAGDVPVAGAVAAVVLYRLISLALVVALGWVAWAAAALHRRLGWFAVDVAGLAPSVPGVADVVMAVPLTPGGVV